MTLTAVGTNVIAGERFDSIVTLPITDSTTITSGDFVELSSGKLIKSVTDLSTSLFGVANTTKTAGVYSTTGVQDYIGVVMEGLVKVKGLVEGSGGTYKTAIAVGTKVSFHYDATAGYGQFVVNSGADPIGTVVVGSVASSGTTADQWDYVLVQLDFESTGASDIPDGTITTAKLGNAAVTLAKLADGAVSATKTAADVPGQINPTKQYMDCGVYAMNATLTTTLVTWSATISSTAGVKVFITPNDTLTKTPVPGTLTATNFTVTSTGAQTGNWSAWIPVTSK